MPKPNTGRNSRSLLQLEGPYRNTAITYICMEKKLELYDTRRWKIFEDTFIRFDRIHERDGRTDGRTDGDRTTV